MLLVSDMVTKKGDRLGDRKIKAITPVSGGHALAAAELADQPDGLAVVDIETDAVDGPHLAVAREERRAQLPHGALSGYWL